MSSNPSDKPDVADNASMAAPDYQPDHYDALAELSLILKTVPDHQHHLIVDAARQAAALLASRPDDTVPGESQ